ncbi:MoxR family ATPase [Stieleria sp. TO1_6]|uniref:AAA family ATPase n=1 Tax=Stieleria tagensis TaxID=2956795 RepID=UPI00209B89CA|nr:MoxR family ATPase [Stieleria tagensis]MCO8125354.1 MoxR family ATPase [Stieleria tagensis]
MSVEEAGNTSGNNHSESGELSAADAARLNDAKKQIAQELGKVIVGQQEVIDEIMIGLFSRGHVLLEGVPGLAKTLMISTLAQTMDLEFSRVQFTPDLMPADVTGTEIIEEDRSTGHRGFRFMEGPLFSNIILADEINRTPPKTQAALLEAMQERQVTVGRTQHTLPNPFFVLATQNPIEQEGTYPLPEAQQDRFMFKIFVSYPSFDDEFEVARRTTGTQTDTVQAVLNAEDIIRLQDLVRRVPVSDHVVRYALSLVRQTRVGDEGVPDFVDELVGWGAGPRAVQFLILGGKARALLEGRFHVSIEDIQQLAKPVLRHRMVVNFAAESDGVTSDNVIDRIVAATPTTEDELSRDARFQKIFAS